MGYDLDYLVSYALRTEKTSIFGIFDTEPH